MWLVFSLGVRLAGFTLGFCAGDVFRFCERQQFTCLGGVRKERRGEI